MCGMKGESLMNKLLAVMMLAGLTGCFTASEVELYRWPVDFSVEAQFDEKTSQPAFGVVRLMQVEVRSPFDGEGLAVLRADGTVAFDPANEFAAAPGLLLRGVVQDAMLDSGRFASVVPSSSVAKSGYAAEVSVVRLCLDCREEGMRRACCEVRFRLLKDREVVKYVSGTGDADAADGDYGKAFSKAVSSALRRALERLDAK